MFQHEPRCFKHQFKLSPIKNIAEIFSPRKWKNGSGCFSSFNAVSDNTRFRHSSQHCQLRSVRDLSSRLSLSERNPFRHSQEGPIGFDAVLGARGSPLQLVLNTVFHLETSPGNIPWTMYQAVKNDPRVELAIPYALGDNYYGFRIVGTTTALFTEFEYRKGVRFRTEWDGRFFDPNRQEAVLGSYAAQKLDLKVGDRFNPYHGLVFDESMRHDEQYVVVGVLEPTNSPSDRVIWIPIDGIYRLEGHVLRGSGEEYVAQPGQEIPDAHKEVSAVMLKFRNPQIGFMMDATINKQGKVATLAWPHRGCDGWTI